MRLLRHLCHVCWIPKPAAVFYLLSNYLSLTSNILRISIYIRNNNMSGRGDDMKDYFLSGIRSEPATVAMRVPRGIRIIDM